MRAAALISTALAGVIKAIANEKHSYAISGELEKKFEKNSKKNPDKFRRKSKFLVDGSTWKSYPKLAEFITQMTQDLIGYDIDVEFRTNFDGSAKGAAFIAASNKT